MEDLGIETEEEAVIDADAGAEGVGALFEADDADEGIWLAGGEAAKQDEGTAGDVAGVVAEGMMEFFGELDDAGGLVAIDVAGDDVVVFCVVRGMGGGGGGGFGFAEGFEVGEGFAEVAAEGVALLVVVFEGGFEGGDFLAEVAEDFWVGSRGGRWGVLFLLLFLLLFLFF